MLWLPEELIFLFSWHVSDRIFHLYYSFQTTISTACHTYWTIFSCGRVNPSFLHTVFTSTTSMKIGLFVSSRFTCNMKKERKLRKTYLKNLCKQCHHGSCFHVALFLFLFELRSFQQEPGCLSNVNILLRNTIWEPQLFVLIAQRKWIFTLHNFYGCLICRPVPIFKLP